MATVQGCWPRSCDDSGAPGSLNRGSRPHRNTERDGGPVLSCLQLVVSLGTGTLTYGNFLRLRPFQHRSSASSTRPSSSFSCGSPPAHAPLGISHGSCCLSFLQIFALWPQHHTHYTASLTDREEQCATVCSGLCLRVLGSDVLLR